MSKQKKVILQPISGRKVATQQPVNTVFRHMMGWNFNLMDDDNQFPWYCSFKRLTKYRNALLQFETKNFETIFKEDTSNHDWDNVEKINIKIRRRAQELNIELDSLCQLALSNKVRVFGIRNGNIFSIIWLDPEHSVYKTEKKNT